VKGKSTELRGTADRSISPEPGIGHNRPPEPNDPAPSFELFAVAAASERSTRHHEHTKNSVAMQHFFV
jgi:hypothetical protein